MSLLTVAQAVAEEVGIGAPSSVIGSSEDTAKQLLRLINRSGRQLAKRNWTILQREHTFTTSNGTASYDLPSDFDRIIDRTAWDRDSYWTLRGGMSPRDWQVKKSGLVSASIRSSFRIKPDTRVNKFFIDPTPSSSIDMVYEYASTQWVKDSSNSAGKTAYAVDTDVSLIPEELIEMDVIWRFLNRKGFAYAEEKLEAEKAIDRAFAADGGMSVIDLGGPKLISESRRLIPEGTWPY